MNLGTNYSSPSYSKTSENISITRQMKKKERPRKEAMSVKMKYKQKAGRERGKEYKRIFRTF